MRMSAVGQYYLDLQNIFKHRSVTTISEIKIKELKPFMKAFIYISETKII
jgi:hypothetical protein